MWVRVSPAPLNIYLYINMIIKKYCNFHGNTDFILRKDGYYRCKKCSVDSVTKRRIILKLKALKYKGEKCTNCGYNKCKDALEFHHVDSTEKDFNISSNITRSWDKIKHELDKCSLLCANCHRELHSIYSTFKLYDEKEIMFNNCSFCNKPTKNKKFCSHECSIKEKSKNIPEKLDLINKILLYKSNVKVGKYYNVSDNTIKKWKIRYNL